MTRQLSPIEAEVYFQTTLEVWQTKDLNDEPSLGEYRELAKVVDRLARLKDASEQREELHDPFVLVWLQHELLCLHEERRRQEGAVPDESDAAGHTTLLIAACERLIERAKAYEPVMCQGCGKAAVFTRRNEACEYDEGVCERCARHRASTDEGAAEFALMTLGFAVTQAELNLTDEEIREALERILADDSHRRREGGFSLAGRDVLCEKLPKDGQPWGYTPIAAVTA